MDAGLVQGGSPFLRSSAWSDQLGADLELSSLKARAQASIRTSAEPILRTETGRSPLPPGHAAAVRCGMALRAHWATLLPGFDSS